MRLLMLKSLTHFLTGAAMSSGMNGMGACESTSFEMQPFAVELDEGIQQIGNEAGDNEWQQHVAQQVDEPYRGGDYCDGGEDAHHAVECIGAVGGILHSVIFLIITFVQAGMLDGMLGWKGVDVLNSKIMG